MDDQRVVEHVEETEERREERVARQEEENQEEDWRREPAEEDGEQPVPREVEPLRQIFPVIRTGELVIDRIPLEYRFPCRDEHLGERRVRFEEVDAVQVFLRARDVVVLVPEERGGVREVVDIRQVRGEDDEEEEENAGALGASPGGWGEHGG